MKNLILICLALVLTLSLVAQNQGSKSKDNSNQPNSQDTSKSKKQMSGKVSSDGKTFTNNADNKSYTVSNPEATKGLEGQQVAIIVEADPDTGTIHITQISAPPQ